MATAKTPKSTTSARAAAKPPAETVKSATVEAETVQAEAVNSAEVITDTVASAAVEAATKPAKAIALASKSTKNVEDTMLIGVESFLEFSRDNAILLVTTGNDFAAGLHKLSQSLIDWSAESCDKSVAGASALLAAKTVEEVIDLSQSLAKDGLQQFLKESTELSNLSTKLIEDTFAPLPGRLAAAVEKLTAHAGHAA